MNSALYRAARIILLTSIAFSSAVPARFGLARPPVPSVYPTVKTVRQPPGGIALRHLASAPEQRYFLYRPPRAGAGARVLVVVHGISRNAEEHAHRFKRLAKQYGIVLVAPLFPKATFPDYQRLGQSGKGGRPDRVLRALLDEVGALTGADVSRVYLFGYSGGGQFVHRYAMAYPDQVAAVAVGAAGWYTFPDPAARFPHGLKTRSGSLKLRFKPAAFLKVPMAALVGERDVRRGSERPELKQSATVDVQQGLTRLERGRHWIEAMRAAAAAHGLTTAYRYEVLPHASHSFKASMKRGHLGQRAFDFLFGPPPARRNASASES